MTHCDASHVPRHAADPAWVCAAWRPGGRACRRPQAEGLPHLMGPPCQHRLRSPSAGAQYADQCPIRAVPGQRGTQPRARSGPRLAEAGHHEPAEVQNATSMCPAKKGLAGIDKVVYGTWVAWASPHATGACLRWGVATGQDIPERGFFKNVPR
jgi:hypothetical protein